MKRSSPLWGSVSVLIGVVIAILALVRGAWLVPLLLLVFTAWGLWVVMFQLQPAWDSIRGYRKKEHDARRQREASLYSTAQANADAMQLLLRHVNHRISAYWCIALKTGRFSIPELHVLLDAVSAATTDFPDLIPDDSDRTRSFNMEFSRALLQHFLHASWRYEHLTEEYLMVIDAAITIPEYGITNGGLQDV